MWREKKEGAEEVTDWSENLDRLLHAGEEVEEEVSVGDAQVIVTTQRVIFFTPYTDGANVRYVDRPNVVGVETRNSGNLQLLGVGTTVSIAGILLIIIGNTLNLSVPESLRDIDESAPAAGLAESIVSAINMIDTALLALGVLLLLNAAAITGYYFLKRGKVVAVAIAGEEDVEINIQEEEDTDRIVRSLREAVSP